MKTLFGFPVVVSDFMPSDQILILGDWSNYIRNATDDELNQLSQLIADEPEPLTIGKLMVLAKRCSLIVNIGPPKEE